jgi:hypothetical protein
VSTSAERCECGLSFIDDVDGGPGVEDSTRTLARRGVCERCGHDTLTTNVAFRQNIGLVVLRLRENVGGRLCSPCVDGAFWRAHTVTCLLGWWGFIAFFSTLVHVPLNLLEYARARLELADERARSFGGWVGWAALLSMPFVGLSIHALSDTGSWPVVPSVPWGLLVLLPIVVGLVPTLLARRSRAR